jgi:hypothetical protein
MKHHFEQPVELPVSLAPLFWDIDWETISWEKYASFITRRILQSGDWDSICWLRKMMGDQALRHWLEEHSGAGLSPRQLRFWGLILSIQAEDVTLWIQKNQGLHWEDRISR